MSAFPARIEAERQKAFTKTLQVIRADVEAQLVIGTRFYTFNYNCIYLSISVHGVALTDANVSKAALEEAERKYSELSSGVGLCLYLRSGGLLTQSTSGKESSRSLE